MRHTTNKPSADVPSPSDPPDPPEAENIRRASDDRSVTDASSSSSASPSVPVEEQVRRFLADDHVRAAEPQKKINFLRTKGIDEERIAALLQEPASGPSPTKPLTEKITQPSTLSPNVTRPLIITYPESLGPVPLPRPPPLVTAERAARITYAASILAMLAYGTMQYFVGPMIEARDEARSSLHAVAARGLAELASQLAAMTTVSSPHALPLRKNDDDKNDDDDDSAKLFHREIGTQTDSSRRNSLTATQSMSAESNQGMDPERDASQLMRLANIALQLRDDLSEQADDLIMSREQTTSVREKLQSIAQGTKPTRTASMWKLGPDLHSDDEIRRVLDSIRGVKGVLLSAKSFPSFR